MTQGQSFKLYEVFSVRQVCYIFEDKLVVIVFLGLISSGLFYFSFRLRLVTTEMSSRMVEIKGDVFTRECNYLVLKIRIV